LVDKSKDERVKGVHELMETLKKKGVALDISHYNALLGVYLENEYLFSSVEFLASLGDIAPNRLTYQRLLYRYCQNGDIEGALKILSHMKDENLTISQSVFESLIMGHGRAGDLAAASDMLAHMSVSGYEPTVDSFTVLAIAQAEAGDLDAVRDTLSKAEVAEQSLSDYNLLEIIFAFAIKGHDAHVDKMIELLQRGSYYNRDCKQMIYKLISEGQVATAEKLYDTMIQLPTANPAHTAAGLFFLRQMLACGRPVSEVLESPVAASCRHPYMLEALLENCLLGGRGAAAGGVMTAMAEQGKPLHAHYFWPSLVAAHQRGGKEVCAVLKDMKERGVLLTSATFRDYIFPGLLKEGMRTDTQVIDFLKAEVGVAPSLTFNELCRYLLGKGQLKRVTDLIDANSISVNPNVLFNIEVGVETTQDHESGAKILSNVRDNQNKVVEDLAGRYLVDLARRSQRSGKQFDAEAAVKALHARGMGLSAESQQRFTSLLASPPSPQMEALLTEMSSGTLQLLSDHKLRPRNTGQPDGEHSYTLEYLESKVSALEGDDNDNGSGLKVLLLRKYISENMVEKAEELWGKMSADILSLNNAVGHQTNMLYMYITNRNLEKALAQLKEIHATSPPDTAIDRLKVVRLALLMVDNGMTEDALKLLDSEGVKYDVNWRKEQEGYRLDYFAGILTAVVSRSKDPELLEKFTACLLKYEYAKPTVNVLRPSVAMHMDTFAVPEIPSEEEGIADTEQVEEEVVEEVPKEVPAFGDSWELEPAFEAFMRVATEHSVMPYQTAMSRRLIRAGDRERLQQALDMSIKIQGEGSALFDLAVAFIEEGKKGQAIKVVQSQNVRFSIRKIMGRFQFYLKRDDSLERIEQLLELTSHIRQVDRRPFFSIVLQAYDKQGDYVKALDLWSRMQEENVTPSNQFLSELAQVLKKHGQPIPFHEPTLHPARASAASSFTEQKKQLNRPEKAVSESTQKMEQLLREHKIDEAIEFYKSEPEDLSFSPAALISKLRVAGRRGEAVAMATTLLRQPSAAVGVSRTSAVGHLLQDLSSAGEYAILKALLEEFPALRTVQASGLLLRAAGSAEQRADAMGALVAWGGPLPQRDLAVALALQPLGASAEGLAGDSAEFAEAVRVARFCRGEAEAPEGMELRAPLLVMRRNQDVSLAPRLLALPAVAGEPASVRRVYSAWALTLVDMEKPAEAAEVVASAQRSVALDAPVLRLVRRACEAAGAPHAIPAQPEVEKKKNKKDSSSSSSSDTK